MAEVHGHNLQEVQLSLPVALKELHPAILKFDIGGSYAYFIIRNTARALRTELNISARVLNKVSLLQPSILLGFGQILAELVADAGQFGVGFQSNDPTVQVLSRLFEGLTPFPIF